MTPLSSEQPDLLRAVLPVLEPRLNQGRALPRMTSDPCQLPKGIASPDTEPPLSPLPHPYCTPQGRTMRVGVLIPVRATRTSASSRPSRAVCGLGPIVGVGYLPSTGWGDVGNRGWEREARNPADRLVSLMSQN